MKRRALSNKNNPRRLHRAWLYAVIWLLLDRLQPPGWVWGVAGTLCVILAAIDLYDFFTAEDVELPKGSP